MAECQDGQTAVTGAECLAAIDAESLKDLPAGQAVGQVLMVVGARYVGTGESRHWVVSGRDIGSHEPVQLVLQLKISHGSSLGRVLF